MVFLSETSISLHKEYLRNLKLRLSIFEKTYPSLRGKSCYGISRLNMNKGEREEALKLKCEILAHEIYFDSFNQSSARCDSLSRQYVSEANFLYQLFRACEAEDAKFLFIYLNGRGEIKYCIENDLTRALTNFMPQLAFDLCEHAYFYDYGFDKSAYLKAALSCLNLSKIENAVANIKKR
ncbi:MAG: hypothetical protein IJ515_02420 [Clostridia bacterium]|nr:hypothetical protein [Clostridia bacterium]